MVGATIIMTARNAPLPFRDILPDDFAWLGHDGNIYSPPLKGENDTKGIKSTVFT